MKLRIKIRLNMLRDRVSKYFTNVIREALFYTLICFVFAGSILGMTYLIYTAGYDAGVRDMAHKYETDLPMCAVKNTEVRENPTGYILSKVNKGDTVWVVQLQVPFAVVWYFNGTDWNLGTTKASNLIPCGNLNKESL